jgi:hypothetical protein
MNDDRKRNGKRPVERRIQELPALDDLEEIGDAHLDEIAGGTCGAITMCIKTFCSHQQPS